MTTTRGRATARALLAAGVLAAATATGCAPGNTTVVDTATVLGGFADRLSRGQEGTYTATYQVTGGGPVTVVWRPPAAAVMTARGWFIVTDEHLIRCAGTTCHRAPKPQPSARPDAVTVNGLADLAGPAFVTPETALATLAQAALAPGAKAKPSRQTIAGQESDCVEVTGRAATGAPAPDPPRDFTVCVTDTGVLASFRGTLATGQHVAVELTRYAPGADPAALTPPAGARVIDVATLPAG